MGTGIGAGSGTDCWEFPGIFPAGKMGLGMGSGMDPGPARGFVPGVFGAIPGIFFPVHSVFLGGFSLVPLGQFSRAFPSLFLVFLG